MPSIVDCYIDRLSIDRARDLVPPEFLDAYRWFEEHEDTTIPRLPMGKDAPFPFAITRQSGIHSPNYEYLDSHGAGKEKYALSIHSEGQLRYHDEDVSYQSNGTWILEYAAHSTKSGKKVQGHYNVELMNCLRDGIPIGVMVRSHNGYHVLGLAFVESYNGFLDVFTIHGPANVENDKKKLFNSFETPEPGSLTDNENQMLASLTKGDERKIGLVEQVRRERQDRFREYLMEAYDGTCAATGTNIPQVLQAAHIVSYRGLKSQIVQNGILLRADVHLLFDAQMLAIEPRTHQLIFGEKLLGNNYCRGFLKSKVAMPARLKDAPDEDLLEQHFREFAILNPSCVK